MAAGLDLRSIEEGILRKKERKLFGTGLAIQTPEGTYGRIAPRSGLAAKHGITVDAGVIDRDYTGEVKILLVNHSHNDYLIKKKIGRASCRERVCT